jgi:hypothetical protein
MEQNIEGGKMHEAVSQEQDKKVIKTGADTTLTKQELRGIKLVIKFLRSLIL